MEIFALPRFTLPTHAPHGRDFDVVGDRELLTLPKTAVFCSSACPGRGILAAMRRFQEGAETKQVYIGGFQTDVETMCLELLLRNRRPVVVFPARSIRRMRIPREWRKAVDTGLMAIASAFPEHVRRPRRQDCLARNEQVAALADRILVVACDPGSHLTRQVDAWRRAGLIVERLVA